MTNIYPSTPKYIKKAQHLLAKGELVAFPTETIYGLWANALLPEAVKKIFIAKNRPLDNPLICHVAKKSDIKKYAYIDNKLQKLIIKTCMPGPCTLLLRPKAMIPKEITAGQPLMSIRIPANSIAQKLLSWCNFPVAAPSANLSTKPSPTSAEMVYENFKETIPMIIDGGETEVGIESTVIRADENKIEILRPGFITKEDLQALVGKDIPVSYTTKGKHMSPGTRYKHYAPKAKVYGFHTYQELKKYITTYANHRIGIIATKEFLTYYRKQLQYPNITIYPRWTKKNLISCAKTLFKLYHLWDKDYQEYLLIEYLPEQGLWYAIMNRVKKSIHTTQ